MFFTHCLGTGAMPPVDVQVLEVGAIIFVRIFSEQVFFARNTSSVVDFLLASSRHRISVSRFSRSTRSERVSEEVKA